MKVIKLIKEQRPQMNEETIRAFIYKNFPNEVITGLEYDDPKTIERALKLLGIKAKVPANINEDTTH